MILRRAVTVSFASTLIHSINERKIKVFRKNTKKESLLATQ